MSISSACPWLRSSWWFTMCFSGHPTRITTSPAPRHPTAPSARRGSDDYTARMHTHHPHMFCKWLHAPDMRLQQQGWMGEYGTQGGKIAARVWDAGWGPEGGQRGQVLPGCIPHVGCRWGGEIVFIFFCQLYLNTRGGGGFFCFCFLALTWHRAKRSCFSFTIQVSVNPPYFVLFGGIALELVLKLHYLRD